jgi:mono/diheme cytochrome c family protein
MAFRIYFGIASLAILVLCVLNYWVELTPEWAGYQREYYELLAAKIDDPAKAAQAAATPVKFVQIYNQQLAVADRCVICHLGMENPLMDGAKNPFKVHPGKLLASHPFQEVGCTICHQGQGLATNVADAHGDDPHWDKPLLTGHFVQAACTKCHHEDDIPEAPVLTRGKHLLHELGCVGCHRTGEGTDDEKVGPRLAVIGSKVSRPWLNKWLINPKNDLPQGKMPQFQLRPRAANALAAYLATFRDKSIDASPDPEGDHDAGAAIFRRLQCITCHVTREDARGNPVGGTLGPDLRKVGNKVSKRWLMAFFQDPHAFYPNTKMPRFYLDDQEAADLAAYAAEEWVDYDLLDAEKQEPKIPPDSPALVEQGKNLFDELACSGCHDLTGEKSKQAGPDLTFEGSKAVHDLDFGEAQVRHTIPDFLYTKLTSPKSLSSHFRLPLGEDYAAAIWKNLQPVALFSKSATLPEPGPEEPAEAPLAWILAKAKEQGVLNRDLVLPEGPNREQAVWLGRVLSEAGALTPLKMPDFLLKDNDADAEALTIALMSQSAERVSLANYEVPKQRKPIFDPKDDFGGLEQRFRCLSCHSIRGSGDPQACDITLEGSKVNRQWLYGFLKNPYSMRRTLTIAMPSFNFPDDQARFMSEYISAVFVDRQIGVGWSQGQDRADAARGKALFDAKGCIACHQVHGQGGDVGPSFTTQVPEFPQGTWVGDKLRPEWIYQWVKDPQALVPDVLDPNLGLSDQEALDLTKYLMSLKNPEVQKK